MAKEETVRGIPISANPIEFRLNALIGAVNRQTDRLVEVLDDRLTDIADVLDDPHCNSEVGEKLTSIFNMLEEISKKMATQEERLQAASAKLDSVATGIDELQAAVAELKSNNPALDDEISAIEAKLEAIGNDLAGTPADQPEPVVEG